MSLLIPIFLFLLFLIVSLRVLEYFRERRGRTGITTEPEQIGTPSTPATLSGIASRINIAKLKPTISIVIGIVVVFMVIIWLLSVFNVQYALDRTENFNNDAVKSFRGYDIEGNYKIENNALHIIGTCVITRKTNADQPWIAFDASGGGLVNVDILDNNLPDYGYDNFKSGQVVITKDKRNYYFKVKGDFYYFYINNNFAESFGIAEGGRRGRERTYKMTIKSVTPEGVWVDNIQSE